MKFTQRIATAWRALGGDTPALPENPTAAGVLSDGRLIVLSRETGTLVFTPGATEVLRKVLATGGKP